MTDSEGATASGSASVTESEETGGDAPTIDTFDPTEGGSPILHLETTVDWGASDADGDLSSVRIAAEDSDGRAFEETHEHSVSGSSAPGTDEFKFRHADGEMAEVTISGADVTGNTASDTERVAE